MIRRVGLRLYDIDTNITVVVDLMKGRSRRHLQNDISLLYAVLHALMIIAEAVRHLPQEAQAAQPAIPWKDIVGIGIMIKHEYHRIDPDVIWNAVTVHLPALRAVIKKMQSDVDQPVLPL